MALSEQLASFFASIKFQVDDKGLKQVDNGIQSLGQRLLGFKSIAGAVGVALQQVVSLKFANITAEEEKFARLNGVLRENVDELKLFATQAGITQETVTSAISQIAKQKQDLMTMRSIPMWVRFGVDPRQSPDKVLKDILKKVKNFTNDTQRQMALLSRLGISREFALAFKEGNFELDEATKKLLKFKQTNAQSSTELANNVNSLKALFSGFLQGLNGIITPIMNLLVKGITKIGKELFVFIEPILTLISKLVVKSTDAIKRGLSFLSPYILFFLKIITFVGAIALGLKALLSTLGLIKLALIVINLLAGSPVLIIAALTTAVLGLWKAIAPESFEAFLTLAKELLEDIIDYLNGVPNTAIGATIEKWKKQWKDFCQGFKDEWDKVWKFFSDKIDAMVERFNRIKNFFKFGNKNDEKVLGERAGEEAKGIRRGIFGQVLSKEDIERLGLKQNVLPKEQEKLGKQEVKKTNNVKNEIRNEITVNTQSEKPFDIANAIVGKVGNVQYSTKIDDENDTAGLSCNVALEGSY